MTPSGALIVINNGNFTNVTAIPTPPSPVSPPPPPPWYAYFIPEITLLAGVVSTALVLYDLRRKKATSPYIMRKRK